MGLITNIKSKLSGPKKAAAVTDRAEPVYFLNRTWNYPTTGLTPETLVSIFHEADQGNMLRQSQLFMEIKQKDLFVLGLLQSRRNAITKLDYQIEPFNDEPWAKEDADFIRTMFKNLREDPANGILGYNGMVSAVAEAVFDGTTTQQLLWKIDPTGVIYLQGTEYWHFKHFRWGKVSDVTAPFNQLRRFTIDNLVDGVELEQNKWLVSVIQAMAGHPAMTSLLRGFAIPWMFKNFDIKSLVQLCEIYGLPLRVGEYPTGAGDDEKNALFQALYQIGQDAAALIPQGSKITFVTDTAKGISSEMHLNFATYLDRLMSIGALGHEGAAVGTAGKLGNDQTAQEVRADLVQSDCTKIDEIISEQVIKAAVIMNKGPRKGYPTHRKIIEKKKDSLVSAQVMDYARNRLNMPLKLKSAYEDLSLEQPQKGDDIILPSTGTPPPLPGQFRQSQEGDIVMGDGKKKVIG